MIDRRPTNELIRKLPEWAKIVRAVNGIDIYNLSILDNILSWTHDIADVAAIDYFGTVITFGELPEVVRWYVNGLKSIENVLSQELKNRGSINPLFFFPYIAVKAIV